VLDQNFPFYITGIPWTRPNLRVSRLLDIDPELTHDHDDWEVFLALGQRGGVDGFITDDAKLLNLPAEMVALHTTSLALVVTDGVGHQPIRATGLLMVHLETISNQLTGKPRICVLRPVNPQQTRPWDNLNRIADRRSISVNTLVDEERHRIGIPRSAMPSDT
jgi:hypothetical protein